MIRRLMRSPFPALGDSIRHQLMIGVVLRVQREAGEDDERAENADRTHSIADCELRRFWLFRSVRVAKLAAGVRIGFRVTREGHS